MSEQHRTAKPAWQIEELEEEWIDLDEDEHSDHQANASLYAHTTSDLSFTQTHGSVLQASTNGHNSPTTSVSAAGTVLIRDDVPEAPFLPHTPGNAKKMFSKNFFSPLALERMFEPPSPPQATPQIQPPAFHKNTPAIPSRLSRVYVPSEEDVASESLDGLGEADMDESAVVERDERETLDEVRPEVPRYQFTFAAPDPHAGRSLMPSSFNPTTPQPSRLNLFTPARFPLPSDPRLKLFQFQYDTFTRDHLSAMVDSIAVHSPAGDSCTANSKDSSPVVPPSPSNTSISRLRSAKRLKLSPASDFSGDGDRFIGRQKNYRDYIGESRFLMDKIRQTQDYSTITTQGSALTPHISYLRPESSDAQRDENQRGGTNLNVPNVESKEPTSTYTTASSKRGIFSSLQFREQAADLMAQIRNDVRSQKRLYSHGSAATPIRQGPEYDPGMDSIDSVEIEPIDYGEDTEDISDAEADFTETLDIHTGSMQPAQDAGIGGADEYDLTRSVGEMSLDSPSLIHHFPPLPVAIVVSSSPTSSDVSTEDVAPSRDRESSKPAYLAPHAGTLSLALPSTSTRPGVSTNDLNRFVSSSTASGVTSGSGATASIVRHEGRPIKLITPDSQLIPDRLGEMVFDQRLMKWVKASAHSREAHPAGTSMRTSESNESEDPFHDIESLREEADSLAAEDVKQDKPLASNGGGSKASRIHEPPSDSEGEDAEEVELNCFSFDGNSLQNNGAPPPAGHQDESALETDSENEIDARRSEETGQFVRVLANSSAEPSLSTAPCLHVVDSHQSVPALQDTPPQLLAPPSSGKLTTPLSSSSSGQAGSVPTSAVRSALKSNSVTPVPALKDPSRSRFQTPANTLVHKRSVSFSDGKREGPIVGIGRNIPTPDVTSESDAEIAGSISIEHNYASVEPSARSKRIAGMLEGLEDSSYGEESPSKANSGRPTPDELQPLSKRQDNYISPSRISHGGGRGRPRRSLSHSHASRSLKFGGGPANATFLTECSFGVAHDRLVQVITDVQPFEPHWENLSFIDLSRKGLESVARLKEFLPKLDSLSLNGNQLAWLSGIPSTVRTLSLASNCMTAVTSFSHLLNLESLDISNNNIDSLRQLECLRHLRELRADGNMIDSVDGLQNMDGLVKLSLQGNVIQDVDLTGYRWTRLEMLNMSQNKLFRIRGISAQNLPALIALNLDHNNLRELEVNGGNMGRLKILRVSGNRLQQLNAGPFPNVRTLYADNNCLGPILKAHRLTKLENLSLRNQSGRAGLSLSMHDVRDVKRLYLSGNPLKPGFISEPCYNLIYLELAACRVMSLPSDMARLTPNLRVLNLNYNFLEDVRALHGLTRLRKLTIIGSRVKAMREFVKMLQGMLDVEMLDFRMNPCTLGWYLPLLVKDIPGALQPSDDNGAHSGHGHYARTERDLRFLTGNSSGTASSAFGARPPTSSAPAANPHDRLEFNVSPRETVTRARGANGFSTTDENGPPPSESAGDTHHQQQQYHHQSADRMTPARVDANADDDLPPPPPMDDTRGAPRRAKTNTNHLNIGSGGAGGLTWKDLDAKFRRDLPDDVYAGRLVYRGLVMRACPRIRTLDGIDVSEKERDKAERLLESVLDRRRPAASSFAPRVNGR